MDALFRENGVITAEIDLETADEFISGYFDEDDVISNEDGEDLVQAHDDLGPFLTVNIIEVRELRIYKLKAEYFS
jgi:hypothetical protein